ncbi:MAG: type II toxin-antitoxin system HicB family antitoxin [Candidatus Diapherotrites archaeon]|nr:type II toxin-antitoxin system HicB family antitoxin [Candidatus Diapherotrites archaeon]
MKILGFSAVVFPEGKSFTSWCPDLDVAPQGKTFEQAISNLKEALTIHLESVTPQELTEIKKNRGQKLLTTVEVAVG